jgi:hypothetical protein
MKRSPIRRRKRTKHQLANVDHREYIAWVHTQPCAACGTRQNIQAAHVGRGGMGIKHGSDAEVIPLCGPRAWNLPASRLSYDGCHAEHDQLKGHFRIGGVTFADRAAIRAWDELHIAVHRGRFEARHVGGQVVPF